jgi:hypothetical protein
MEEKIELNNAANEKNEIFQTIANDPFEEFEKKRDIKKIDVSENKNNIEKVKLEKDHKDEKKLDENIQDKEKEIESKEYDDSSVIDQLNGQIEKERKNLLEAQRWGTKNSQKVKGAHKTIKSLLENGSFTSDEEEELSKALSILSTEGGDIEEEHLPSSSHPLQKYFDIANTELPKFKTYGNDPNLENKIASFNHFIKEATAEEIKDLIDTLEDADTDALKIKKMLSIGEKNYNEGFKEIIDNGGARSAIQKKNKEIERLTKEIERYKKKLTEHENYDTTTVYGVNGMIGSEDDSPAPQFADPFDAFEHKRDSARKR